MFFFDKLLNIVRRDSNIKMRRKNRTHELIEQLKKRFGDTYDVRAFVPIATAMDFFRGFWKNMIISFAFGVLGYLGPALYFQNIIISFNQDTIFDFNVREFNSGALLFSILTFLLTIIVQILWRIRCFIHNEDEVVYAKFEDSFEDCVRVPNYVVKESLSEGEDCRVRCKNLDRLIAPPLEYCRLVLDGGNAPDYNSDAKFINTMFEADTVSVIALTGISPSMWLNPTLYYHLVNSCLISLVKELNREIKESKRDKPGNLRISTVPYICSSELADLKIVECRNALKGLLNLEDHDGNNNFFTRIFFLDKYEAETSFVISLRDVNELFRIKTILVGNQDIASLCFGDGIEESRRKKAKERIDTFRAGVRDIHKLIGERNSTYRDFLDREMQEYHKQDSGHLIPPNERPEFLIVIKKSIAIGNKVEINTYKNGIAYVATIYDFELIQKMLTALSNFLMENQELWLENLGREPSTDYARVVVDEG